MARDCEGGSGRYRGSRTLPVCNCQFQNTSSAIATLLPMCYLSQLKHLDMNAIVLGKRVRLTSFIKLKQERIKGTEKASPIHILSIGNSSRVIFRIGIKLPCAQRDVSWRFRMTKRRAKHVGRKAMKV